VTSLFQSDALSLFTELAAIPSPSGTERAVADRVYEELRALGLEPEVDDSGASVGSDCGNVYARIEPTKAGTPIFFCAHFDTVVPTGPIEPVIEDGIVRNAAGTILGADNKATVAAMLVAAATILRENRLHAGVELLFTPKEEVGLLGASAFDQTRLQAQLGYVYDQAAPVGQIVLGAPTQRSLHVRFHGRAAHAGMVPEEGRSAIAAAARAIAELRLGRLDDETTANVGTIAGGTARNIVPEWCSFEAEARSHDDRKLQDLVQEMLDSITFAAQAADCEVETQIEETYRGYRFRREDVPVRLAADALRAVGVEPTYALTGGGADANVFTARGVPCVNVANGMAEIHTPDEHVAVADLERMVAFTLALVEEARGAALA
jgi:tripeptide aminopeptidase